MAQVNEQTQDGDVSQASAAKVTKRIEALIITSTFNATNFLFKKLQIALNADSYFLAKS